MGDQGAVEVPWEGTAASNDGHLLIGVESIRHGGTVMLGKCFIEAATDFVCKDVRDIAQRQRCAQKP